MSDDKRWCSQHQGYIVNVGGKEKPVKDGLKKRWICARCCGEHSARKQHLTVIGNKNTNREK